MLTKKWTYTPPAIRIGEFRIWFAQSIRYLGVHLDWRRGFGPHCKELATKLTAASTAVSRLLPNASGQT